MPETSCWRSHGLGRTVRSQSCALAASTCGERTASLRLVCNVQGCLLVFLGGGGELRETEEHCIVLAGLELTKIYLPLYASTCNVLGLKVCVPPGLT